jgi:hypothetical protein
LCIIIIKMKTSALLTLALACTASDRVGAFLSQQTRTSPGIRLCESASDEDDSEKLRKKAEDLREQIRKMEENLGDNRPRNYDLPKDPVGANQEALGEPSLKKKRVLVVGANGRLGAMVCRHLLRNNPETEVVACVHYVGEDSFTSRGYGRLSYEVGAEDGVGTIGSAWSAEDRVATFEYADYMKDYNLRNLRLVECELLDPVQCNTICEGVDSVIWCATDFNGNQPRAVSGLNVAFLFRAVTAPDKGRVEVEGLRNILGGLKNAKNQARYQRGESSSGGLPHDVVLVSTMRDAFEDFETPFGTFHGLKREGEDILKNEFPSLSYAVLQMGRYDDNFVEEGMEALYTEEGEDAPPRNAKKINRRDAAKAASDALMDDDLTGKTVQVFTSGK